MPRQRIVWLNGQRMEVDPDWSPPPRRFYIIGDQHRPFRSMADGRMYDSKSRYRAEAKARGYVELGNDQIEPAKPAVGSAADDLRRTASEMGISL